MDFNWILIGFQLDFNWISIGFQLQLDFNWISIGFQLNFNARANSITEISYLIISLGTSALPASWIARIAHRRPWYLSLGAEAPSPSRACTTLHNKDCTTKIAQKLHNKYFPQTVLALEGFLLSFNRITPVTHFFRNE